MKDQVREDLHLTGESGPETDAETLLPETTPREALKRAVVRRLIDRTTGGETRARKLLRAEK